MFDLEQSIVEWRRQMLAAGIKTLVPLEELENHLREEIGRYAQSGSDPLRAFELATGLMGQAGSLKTEFNKVAAENWNRPLAWMAWCLFVVSFFLPAYANGRGWQCAGVSIMAMPDFQPANWGIVHLESLSLANLLMISSPLFLMYFSRSTRLMNWFRISTFLASVLVWTFVLLLLAHADGKDLKIGCYVWAASFLSLCLSTLKIRSRKLIPVRYV